MKNSQRRSWLMVTRNKISSSLSHTFVEFTFCVWFSKPQSFHIILHTESFHFPYNYDYDMLYFLSAPPIFLIILVDVFCARHQDR